MLFLRVIQCALVCQVYHVMNLNLKPLVQRSVYKDLVCLLRDDELLTLEELKEKVCHAEQQKFCLAFKLFGKK